MDYNLIGTGPMQAGWGSVYQGGAVDAAVKNLPAPLAIVCLDAGEQNESWIDHEKIECVLSIWIEDSPLACLKDQVLLSLVDAALAFLRGGMNVYVHCAAGISRSSYMTCAIYMRGLRIGFDDALALVRRTRATANPNDGFVAQLRRIEQRLKTAP